MKRSPIIAGILSLVVPGLGQIYAGEGNKGAATIVAAIVIGNLNIIVLPLIALANPVDTMGTPNPRIVWTYWIPRLVHDLMSFWSLSFWAWAVVDAVAVARKPNKS